MVESSTYIWSGKMHTPATFSIEPNSSSSLSPGCGLHASRLVAQDSNCALVATGSSVYSVKIPDESVRSSSHARNAGVSLNTTDQADIAHISKKQRLSTESSNAETFGIGSNLSNTLLYNIKNSAEIQSIELHRPSGLLGAAADDGSVYIFSTQNPKKSYSLRTSLTRDVGWAGISFDGNCSSSTSTPRVAVCHTMLQNATVFDGEKIVRNFPVSMPISDVKWATSINSKDSLFITAADSLKITDLRDRKNFFKEVQPIRGDSIYSLAVSGNGNAIAVAGKQGSVSVYDCRMWSVMYRWKVPVKYSVISILMSPPVGDNNSSSEMIYAIGSDHEIHCSGPNWGQSVATKKKLTLSHSAGMRGASRWIGADLFRPSGSKNSKDDVLFSVCEGGHFYAVRGASRLQLPQK